MNQAQSINRAVDLMTQALELLDEKSERDAARHLQQAIDVARRTPIPKTIEEADALLASPEAQALDARLNRSPNETDNDDRIR